jgi:excisionase family DNA binding protein
MDETDDLIPVPKAAERAGVSRNTMLLAAKHGKIRAKKLGRNWFVYSSDIERWKREEYRPDMAFRYPVNRDEDKEST